MPGHITPASTTSARPARRPPSDEARLAYAQRAGRVLEAQWPAIDGCRTRHAPDARGLLVAELTIAAAGRVAQRLRALVFPPPPAAPYAHVYRWQFATPTATF